MVAKEAAAAGLTFCCLQEVKYLNSGKKLVRLDTGENFEFHWCGNRKRRKAGVGFLIRVDPRITIKDPDTQDPRIMAINLNVYGFNIRVVNAYAPTNSDGSENQKDAFYKQLKKVCIKQEKHQKLIVAGDFNAKTSIAFKQCHYNGRMVIQDSDCNDNGFRLKSFCRDKNLCIASSYFDHVNEDRYTWYSPDKKTKRVNDYVLTEEFVQEYVTDCVAKPEFDFDSDHCLLQTCLCTPMTRRARWKFKSEQHKPNKTLDINSLKDTSIEEKFQDLVTSQLSKKREETESTSEQSKKIVNIVKFAAENVLSTTIKRNRFREIWKEDKELNFLLRQRKQTFKSSSEFKSLSKAIKVRVNALRNLKLQQETDEINENVCHREVSQLYRCVKSDYTAFRNTNIKPLCDPNVLKNHFMKHFNRTLTNDYPIELTNAPEFIKKLKSVRCDLKTCSPDLEELNSTIEKLKNGKAANDVPAEYLKSAMNCLQFQTEMVSLYRTIWKTKKIPSEWRHSKLVSIWKGVAKGSCKDPRAYRGLQIGSSLCKIIVLIIINRLKSWYESQLLDQQQGFRTGRGTTDGIFIEKCIHQITDNMRKPVYSVFIDLTAAFDHVERNWMFKTIHQRFQLDDDKKLIELLESIYSHTTTALSQSPNDIFDILLGVRQGGPESPLLFNLYIDYVMRIFHEQCTSKQINFLKLKYRIPASATTRNRSIVGTQKVDWVGYADDIVLNFEDTKNMQRAIDLLSSIFTRYHLEINVSKTKSIIMNHQYLNTDYPTSIVNIHGKPIDNVKIFKYLGCHIKYDEASTGDSEINLRIDAAEHMFYTLGNKIMNHKIMLSTRIKIFNALVRSRMTYACQIWNLTKKQRNHINSKYISMIRKMVKGGYRRKEGSFSYVLSNQDLLQKSNTESITRYVQRQQRNYVAHTVRKPDNSITKKLLFNGDRPSKQGRKVTLYRSVIENEEVTPDAFHTSALSRQF